MIVCHCRTVSDRTIRAAVRAGAMNEERVAEMCGAGTCCGGCRPVVAELISDVISAAMDEETRGARRLVVLSSHEHEHV